MRRKLVLLLVGAVFPVLLLAGTASARQVRRWGSFFDGGSGSSFETALPTPLMEVEGVKTVDAGNAAIYILTEAGSVYAVGDGSAGELGNGNLESTITPVKVSIPEGDVVTGIGEADNAGYAVLSTGGALAWGENGNGNLCIDKPGKETLPTPVAIKGTVEVQGGAGHVIFRLANGHVMSCGENADGQLGIGETPKIARKPVEVPGLSEVVQISAGVTAAGALTRSGALYMWGRNKNGEVCDGTQASAFEPVKVLEHVTSFSEGGDVAGNGHTLALVGASHELYGCGANGSAEATPGVAGGHVLTPTTTGYHFAQAVASGGYSLGLNAAGEVFAWGNGEAGELGTGDGARQLSPVRVDSGATFISGTARDSADMH